MSGSLNDFILLKLIFWNQTSPHVSVQTSWLFHPPPTQEYPYSIEQAELHPSPEITLASSHYILIHLPSPQISLQTVGEYGVPGKHENPGS